MTQPPETPSNETEPPQAPLPRLGLREPLGDVIEDSDAYAAYCAQVTVGSGPVALDAERASGYRYSQRAYLVQVRREHAGTGLIDPIAFDDLSDLNEAIGDAEWILHAATQDLPCLAEVGLRPTRLFDTELAGRLLNLPRVGLATLVEHYLGLSLAKEHSAADWSTRPLPRPWLEYAALDVEVLVELRDLVEADLERAGKLEWARQDFEALLSFTGTAPREEPWRRTSGIHRARGRRMLGLVKALWEERDAIAEQRDTTPGRILPDAALMEIAKQAPQDASSLRQLAGMRGRGPRRFTEQWLDAVREALALPEDELPSASPRGEGPPPPRAWPDRHPEAAERLGRAREVTTGLADQHDLPTENLIAPSLVRALAWEPPSPLSPGTVGDALLADGARQWQVELVATPLAEALRD
ncbi:ribonuclease D [Aeromicrobium sp. CTD01-1L150]|uniref:ribonuclease D n=1 Tax=Aeromicrobium sp. CTD01-1L150 TaxID=3341830 RepID=UPI0035C03B69